MVESDASTINTNVTLPQIPNTVSSNNVDADKLPWHKRILKAKGTLLFIIAMAQMLDIINVASVTIALPSIQRDVHYKPSQLQWIVSSYALTYAGFLLVGGRMGDLFGHRRIFLLGTSWFAIWSLVCGFARDPIFMSVSRGFQGLGAGFTIPSALALLTTTYPLGPERTFALSVFGGAACIGQTIGVLLGGIFDATIGWYWIFYITAIIAALISIGGFLIISKENDNPATADRRIDYFGVLLFMLGIIGAVYYLSQSNTSGWGSAVTLAPFIVGLALLVAFIFWEKRIEYPIMPFHIWASRRFFSSVIVITCLTACYGIMIFFTSLTFQEVLGFSPIITACCYIVHGLGLLVGLSTVTRLFAYVRTKIVMGVCWVFVIVSGIIFAQITPDSTYWHYAFPALIVNCLGLAPVWMCCQVNAVADASDENQGVVGAVFNVALQLGGPIGLAIATIVSQNFQGHGDSPAELMDGYRSAFYCLSVFAGVGIVLGLLLASNHDPIEFSGVAPDSISGDAERGIEAIKNSSSSVVEDGDKTEISESNIENTLTSNASIIQKMTEKKA
ncbi:hypothetical protein BGZ76_007591 [Entomortierella beljakovae]|nr:hypothetical protein BGZ76_007591 [Entomortierella beljakovae]